MIFNTIIIRVSRELQSNIAVIHSEKVAVKKSKSKTIGEIIAEARKKSGLSLRAVAGRIPINFTYLAEIEKGNRKPSEKVIKALSEQTELNLDFDFLMAHSGRLGEEAEKYLENHPSFGRLLRNIARKRLTEIELDNLNESLNTLEH